MREQGIHAAPQSVPHYQPVPGHSLSFRRSGGAMLSKLPAPRLLSIIANQPVPVACPYGRRAWADVNRYRLLLPATCDWTACDSSLL